jgi:hypothetical protein
MAITRSTTPEAIPIAASPTTKQTRGGTMVGYLNHSIDAAIAMPTVMPVVIN